jgi:hypothetical protein
MTSLIPTNEGKLSGRSTAIEALRSASARRQLDRLRDRTMLRLANAQSQGLVATEKLHEIEATSREAMTGQAMLHNWANTMADGDPVVRDDMGHFLALYRAGTSEVMADLIDTYCREARS